MLGSYENVQPLVQISRTVPWFIYKIFVNVCTIFGVRYQALKLDCGSLWSTTCNNSKNYILKKCFYYIYDKLF